MYREASGFFFWRISSKNYAIRQFYAKRCRILCRAKRALFAFSVKLERVEDGAILSIDCIAIEDEYGNTPAQRAELDWLLYNKPLEYAQLVLRGEIEHYL